MGKIARSKVWRMREVSWMVKKEKGAERKRNLVNEKGLGWMNKLIPPSPSTVLIFPSMASSKVSILSQPDTLNLPIVPGEAPDCREARWGGNGGRWNLPITSMASFYPRAYPHVPRYYSAGPVGMSPDLVLWESNIMSPSGEIECGAIVLSRAIKPPSGQTRASLFLYEAGRGNKETSHRDREGLAFVEWIQWSSWEGEAPVWSLEHTYRWTPLFSKAEMWT